ncbi:enhancer of mRNA decapping [Pseudocyphellaria aurata]|nr:enhancer of mRNA decapping [Pseudocyphellaria aurata]
MVEGTNILELEIEPEVKLPTANKTAAPALVDPAILSYRRPPDKGASASPGITIDGRSLSQFPDSSVQGPLPTAARLPLKPTIPVDTKPKENIPLPSIIGDDVASTALTSPFAELSLHGGLQKPKTQEGQNQKAVSPQNWVSPEIEQSLPIFLPAKSIGKRNRRGAAKGRSGGDVAPAPVHPRAIQHDSINSEANQGQNTPKRPKGWRQTPLTEAAPPTNTQPTHLTADSYRPEATQTRKRARRRQIRISEDPNGWATEEATDIQDMGDFDFEGNLSKFDKRGVFDKIRQEDTTADEDRLVSFNRVPARPGTAGGKNLHYTENVLDSPNANGHVVWNSGDSEKDISDAKVSSGPSSHRNVSRVSVRKPPSRKGSAIPSNEHMAGSGLLSDPVARTRYSSHDQAGSPKVPPNRSVSRFSKKHGPSGASLRISSSDHECPCLTPIQMVELEQLAVSELGLTEEIMTENAARGIAETARKIVMAGRELSQTINSGSPLIVVLIGNNKSGARAVAAGRHLRNHGSRVVVCVLGLDREEDLLDSVRRQLGIYRKCGGNVTKADELDNSLKSLHAPTELIVDSLLGMHLSFDDLRTDDQEVYFQLATWANNSEASVLAIDVPSGLDASSGTKHFFGSGV